MTISLRTFILIDSLQPQLASYLGTSSQGFLPVPGDACLWIEVAPGMAVHRLSDIALKRTNVHMGEQVVERDASKQREPPPAAVDSQATARNAAPAATAAEGEEEQQSEAEAEVGVPEAVDSASQAAAVVSDSSGVRKGGYGWKAETLPRWSR